MVMTVADVELLVAVQTGLHASVVVIRLVGYGDV
jgi:hypothetical protein